MAQLSTALSDLVLALSSFYAAQQTNGRPYQSCYGLIIIGLAASFGVCRFGLTNPNSDLVDGHKLLSWLGSVIGVPFIAAGLLKRNGHSDIALALTFIPVGFLFIYKILPRDVRSVGNSALSTVAVLSIVVSSILVKNFYGMYTAIAIIVAGTFVGTEGEILSVPRVDIFHYMLAIGNLLYIKAVFGK